MIEFAFNISKYIKSEKTFYNVAQRLGYLDNIIDSCKIAIQKAKSFHIKKIKSSIAASDAFFPLDIAKKLLISAGIKIIVQPGGSIRDQEVIKAADKAKIKMIFTNTRHFKH